MLLSERRHHHRLCRRRRGIRAQLTPGPRPETGEVPPRAPQHPPEGDALSPPVSLLAPPLGQRHDPQRRLHVQLVLTSRPTLATHHLADHAQGVFLTGVRASDAVPQPLGDLRSAHARGGQVFHHQHRHERRRNVTLVVHIFSRVVVSPAAAEDVTAAVTALPAGARWGGPCSRVYTLGAPPFRRVRRVRNLATRTSEDTA